MRRFLFGLCLISCLHVRAQEEKQQVWGCDLYASFDNYGCWSVEPSVTFRPVCYAGVSVGMFYSRPFVADYSFNGVTSDNRLRWSVEDVESIGEIFAFRSSLSLFTPPVLLGSDKEYALYLTVSPGATVPFVADRRVVIDYYPNQAGAWTAIHQETIKNRGARKVFWHIRTALTLEVDEHLVFLLAYTCSDFDPYASFRNLVWEGRCFEAKKHRLSHMVSIGIGIRF